MEDFFEQKYLENKSETLSKMKMQQLGLKLSSMQHDYETEKQSRQEAFTYRSKQLDEKLHKLQVSNNSKFNVSFT